MTIVAGGLFMLQKLVSVNTGTMWLDGGAMFGVVPRTLWAKMMPPDNENRVEVASRSLIVVTSERVILIDCGLGNTASPEQKERWNTPILTPLVESISNAGIHPSGVTDVLLTHLHFDHAGGASAGNGDGKETLVLPEATHWIQRRHLRAALAPNGRERPSFRHGNVECIATAPLLRAITPPSLTYPELRLMVFNGHTHAMQLPIVQINGRPLLFAGDLFPTSHHISLNYIMGYDARPQTSYKERQKCLAWAVKHNAVLFYQHDPENECGTVRATRNGNFVSDKTFPLSAIG